MKRRTFLQGTAAAGASVAAGCVTPRVPDRVRRENARPGTTDWMLSNTRVDPATKYRCPWIEGYCSRTSLRAGETLRIFVSTNPASPFTLDLYRMGYYGGAGGRHVRSIGPLPGSPQPDPPVGVERVRECAWAPAAEIRIPPDWPSGVYLGKLTAEREGLQSYVIFIVRDDRPCDFLFQCSDTTWSAYNRWPDQWSLYDDGNKPWYWGPDVRVSWDRPYGKYCQILDAPLSQGSGEFLLWEFPLAFWMEQHGYDVSYISNVDTHADPAGLRRARAFLSVGHDEYWTPEMYRHVKGAIDDGLNAAFLSGNSCFGLIQLFPSADGTPHRAYSRQGIFGPWMEGMADGFPEMKRFKVIGPPEAELMGARSTHPFNGGADWTCVRPDHWVFEGTGMKQGDSIPGLVGWEHHGAPAALPGLEVLARGPVLDSKKKPRGVDYTATIYPGPRGNHVFNAATIWWSDGLSEPPGYVRPTAHANTPPGPDPRVQRITSNLFRRFVS